MNSTQRITLKAFLIALAQQKSLPEGLDILSNLDNLNLLGNTYFPEAYQAASDLLHIPAASRNKGPSQDIDDIAERRKSETPNMVMVNTFDEMDDEELLDTATLADNSWDDFARKVDRFGYSEE